MENKYKIIALVGKAGAGKDTFLNEICYRLDDNVHKIISYTTRNPRENEVDGVDYHFITRTQFAELAQQNQMIEYTEFNHWFYGTGYGSLDKDKINIGVFNICGLKNLKLDKNVDVYAYYIDATPKNRLLRQLNREIDPDVLEILRRFSTDESDFRNISNYANEKIPNNNEAEFEKGIKHIISKMK